MRVYTFTAPAGKNRNSLEDRLSRQFGGFTSWPGIGSWKNPEGFVEDEGVFVYSVAVHETRVGELRDCILFELKALGEQATYIQESGTASIYTL